MLICLNLLETKYQPDTTKDPTFRSALPRQRDNTNTTNCHKCIKMQDFKNISPALYENSPTQMSSREFQRMLYSWFEEKGLVSDLRSYLRVLMINELRNTSVGKVDHHKTNFSLSKQAFCLVIAEHLMREGCHYTLSIFSTEVPGIANQLPVSLFEAHCRHENWRFDQDSLLNVLELMGISRGSDECLRIASLYSRNRDSLLTCLVNAKTASAEVSDIDKLDGDYVDKVLAVLGVPSNIVHNVKTKIYDSINQETLQEKKQIEEMEALLAERNNQIRLLLEEQLAQKKENKKLKNDLKETQKRMKQSLLQEKNLNLRETQIKKKLDEVTRLQRGLEKTLTKEKSEVCLLKHCSDACQSMTTVNEELRTEVAKLEEINREKILEIERLNAKLTSLSKDLQNSKLNIEFLNSCLLRSSQINLQQGEEHPSSSEETSDNLTVEVIQQVRSRLQALERESDELDVKFKKLKMNEFVTK